MRAMTTRVAIDESAIRQVEPMLLAMATRAVRNRDVARDLVQETYVAAMQGLSGFQGRSTLRTWMVGILGRKIVDHYRRSRREFITDEVPEPQAPSRFSPVGFPTAERRLDDKVAMDVLERSFDLLTAQERMAVLWCDVQQQSRSDACRAIGVERNHLRVLLHRGRHKLRRALEAAECAPAPTLSSPRGGA